MVIKRRDYIKREIEKKSDIISSDGSHNKKIQALRSKKLLENRLQQVNGTLTALRSLKNKLIAQKSGAAARLDLLRELDDLEKQQIVEQLLDTSIPDEEGAGIPPLNSEPDLSHYMHNINDSMNHIMADVPVDRTDNTDRNVAIGVIGGVALASLGLFGALLRN